MEILLFLGIAAGSYLLGGLNGAIITSRLVYRDDVRKHGSGNAGLTNFYRTYGSRAVFLLILIDVLKTAVPVIVGGMLVSSTLTFAGLEERMLVGRTFGGLFAMVGHAYPVLYHFKGGKGVLAGGTTALFIDIRVGLVVWGIFIVTVLLTKYVSLGSVLAGIGLPLALLLFGMNPWAVLCAALCGLFLVYCHRENIVRLFRGQERKLSFGKKRKAALEHEQQAKADDEEEQ